MKALYLFWVIAILSLTLVADSGTTKKRLTITTTTLFVRATPSTTAKKLHLLAKGDIVLSLEEKQHNEDIDWIKIEYGVKEQKVKGWIAAQYTAAFTKKSWGLPNFMHDYPAMEKDHKFPGNPPVKVRGIYLSMFSAMRGRLRTYLRASLGSGINTFVIDIKNTNGRLLYRDPAVEKFLPKAYKKAIYSDISYIKQWLAPRKIYKIARIPVFKDDLYARTYPDEAIKLEGTDTPFEDRNGMHWVSPCSKRYWDYVITISEGAADAGFNEIQFDYIRFPDVNKAMSWGSCGTRREIVRNFLLYAAERLHKKNVFISADVFGLVSSVSGDLHIGQYWEAMSSAVDYICPMIYPSHYATGFAGLKTPDSNPRKTVGVSVWTAKKRNRNIESPAKIRPWIQDFTAFWIKGHINYGDTEIRAQIEALEKTGIDEYLLWNPKNRYHYKATTP